MLFKLSIGSNNKTKKLEDKKAIKITSKHFEGFSSYKGLGYWHGKPERTLFIEIETIKDWKIIRLSRTLCEKLNQNAIMVAKIGQAQFVSA